MLSINVALGFRPAGGSGEWQLKLRADARRPARHGHLPPARPALADLLERHVVETVRGQDRVDGAVRRGVRGGGLHEDEVRSREMPCSRSPSCSGVIVVERAAEQGAVGPACLDVTADGHAADADEPRAVEQPVARGRRRQPEHGQRPPLLVGVDGQRELQLVRERDPALVDLVADPVERGHALVAAPRDGQARVAGLVHGGPQRRAVVVRPAQGVDASRRRRRPASRPRSSTKRADLGVEAVVVPPEPAAHQRRLAQVRPDRRQRARGCRPTRPHGAPASSPSPRCSTRSSLDASDRSPVGPTGTAISRASRTASASGSTPSSTTSPDGPPAADRPERGDRRRSRRRRRGPRTGLVATRPRATVPLATPVRADDERALGEREGRRRRRGRPRASRSGRRRGAVERDERLVAEERRDLAGRGPDARGPRARRPAAAGRRPSRRRGRRPRRPRPGRA